MHMRLSFIVFVGLMVLGCAAAWTPVNGLYNMESENFTVTLPEGWQRYNHATSQVIITRQGMQLQRIAIFRTPIDKKLPFTRKMILPDMLPQEVAEVVIDNLKSNPNISNGVVLENDPALISGQAGFKLIYSFRTREGLDKKGVFYGLLQGNQLYKLVYEAPQRYYFDKDLQTFETTVASFRLIKI